MSGSDSARAELRCTFVKVKTSGDPADLGNTRPRADRDEAIGRAIHAAALETAERQGQMQRQPPLLRCGAREANDGWDRLCYELKTLRRDRKGMLTKPEMIAASEKAL